MKISIIALLAIPCFFAFESVAWAAKIAVKTKSIIQLESEQKVPFEIKCQTKDNTEISIKGTSPSEHVIFTAKQLNRCEISKEKGRAEVRIRLIEGKITDELKKLRVITEKTILKIDQDSKLILFSKTPSTKKNPKKRRLSAKR